MDARALLHTADDVAVPPYEPAAVRRAARTQRTRLVLRAAGASVTGVAAALLGVAVLGGAPDRVRPVTPPEAIACPEIGRHLRGPAREVEAPADRMLTPGPLRVAVCAYGIPPAAPRVTEVSGDDPVVVELVEDLNAIPVLPPRLGSCPMDSLDHVVLVARYSDGHTETVSVNPDGCRSVSNGTRHSYSVPPSVTGALLRIDLRTVLADPPRPWSLPPGVTAAEIEERGDVFVERFATGGEPTIELSLTTSFDGPRAPRDENAYTWRHVGTMGVFTPKDPAGTYYVEWRSGGVSYLLSSHGTNGVSVDDLVRMAQSVW